MRRVAITGIGSVSPFGTGVAALIGGLRDGRSAVVSAQEFAAIAGLRSRVKAVVGEVDEKIIPRKYRRAMSNMSIYAVMAAMEAWENAGLGPDDAKNPRTGVSIGSTLGSPDTSEVLFREYMEHSSLERMKATLFFQIMGHSVAANVAQYFGVQGRTVAPSSACATGCQALGLGYEFIKYGLLDRAICGGADELHPMTTATFDIINASSAGFNDTPQATPRPFDANRDGVVCGEGAGVLILEDLELARARGAKILGEIMGFATLSDSVSMAHPNAGAMEQCMRMALDNAGVAVDNVDYVNAHATGTLQGDVSEAEAVRLVFGDRVPVSSLKGNIGHTMAASGAIETVAVVNMLGLGEIYPTHNLADVAPECAGVDHVTAIRSKELKIVLKNSFAMGGVNCSLVLGRGLDD